MAIRWRKYYGYSTEINDWIKHGMPSRLSLRKSNRLRKGDFVFVQEAVRRELKDGKAIAVFAADGDVFQDHWKSLDYILMHAITNPEKARFKFKITDLHPEILVYKRTDPTVVDNDRVWVSVVPV